jgi:hypothetical protein
MTGKSNYPLCPGLVFDLLQDCPEEHEVHILNAYVAALSVVCNGEAISLLLEELSGFISDNIDHQIEWIQALLCKDKNL